VAEKKRKDRTRRKEKRDDGDLKLKAKGLNRKKMRLQKRTIGNNGIKSLTKEKKAKRQLRRERIREDGNGDRESVKKNGNNG
jgi:hypothetical protein